MRDQPGRFPFAYLLVGILAVKQGGLSEARESLNRFLAGPFQGNNWRQLALELLEDMNTGRLER